MSVTDLFPKRLIELREAANMSQDDLAETAGISRGAISQYETGKRLPKIDVLERLSDALSASSQYLLGITDNVKEEYSYTGMQLGLSDKAIEKWSNNESAVDFMDYIVCHEKFEALVATIRAYVTKPWPELFGSDYQAFLIAQYFITILNDIRVDISQKKGISPVDLKYAQIFSQTPTLWFSDRHHDQVMESAAEVISLMGEIKDNHKE